MYKEVCLGLVLIIFGPARQAQDSTTQYVSDTQGLTFEDLAQTALDRNKDLAVARESLHQAEARLTQARLRPNPELEVSHGTDVMFGNDGDRSFSVTLSEPLELGGKRSKRVRVEEAAVEVTRAEIADAERQLLGRLRTLYVEAIGAAARVELYDRLGGLNQQLTGVMQVRERAGDASRLDAQLLAAQTNQVRAQRLVAENQLAGTMLQIRTLAGLSPADPVLLKRTERTTGIQETEETVVARAFENRPDLKAARLREDLAEAGIALANAQAVPNAAAFVRYGRESVAVLTPGVVGNSFDRENVMEFGVSLPLPLFNHQQGNIAEAVSGRAQERLRREALESAIRRDVLLAYRRYKTAQRTLDLLQTGVAQPNQDSLQIVRLAYSLGEMRLVDLVNQQRIVVETGTSLVDAQTELNSALSDLELAMGVIQQP